MENLQNYTIFFVSFMIFLAVDVKAESKKQEMKDMLMNLADECIKKTSVSEAEIESMINMKPSLGKEGKCFKSCLMMQFEMMDDTGNFNESGTDKILTMMAADNEEKLKIGKEMNSKCTESAKDETDTCEKAEKYTICFTKEIQDRGLNVDEQS